VTFVLLVLATGLIWGINRLRWKSKKQNSVDEMTDGPTIVIVFYERLQKIIASLGVERMTGQTPREFARTLASQLPQPVATVPSEVTEVFYAVRYGHRKLADDEVAGIESRLNQLDQLLRDSLVK